MLSAAGTSTPCLSGCWGPSSPWGARLPPAGTELENTLAESHFPGERDSAALSRRLWQQVTLARVPVSLREAICFPTATREATAVLQQESLVLPEPRSGSLCQGPHRPRSPDAGGSSSAQSPGAECLPASSGRAWRPGEQPVRLLGVRRCHGGANRKDKALGFR